ncbi:MAG: hypothetical protein ACRDZ3_16770 [Acidimicrobiia bacterium]
MQSRFSLILLALGVLLLWPVPLGGALLLVTASIGLAIAFESDMAPAGPELALEPAEVEPRTLS